MYQVVIFLILVITTYKLFNPYLSFEPKSVYEQWTTRERSYGHPYYWKMRYCPETYAFHPDAYNRRLKKRCYLRTTMYLE